MSLTPILDLPILFHHYGGKGETLSAAKGRLLSLLGKAFQDYYASSEINIIYNNLME